ncbi:MAG: LptA/OstA family protein [Verrucomicrobiia bacterium]
MAVTIVILLGVGALAAEPPVATPSPSPTNSVAAKPPTTITSDRMEVDYEQNIYTFKDHVLLVDTQMTLRADQMVVFYGTSSNTTDTATNALGASAGMTSSIQKMIATGSVDILEDQHHATCGRAVYTADDNRIVLTENAKVVSPDNTITGEKIVIWRGQNRMEVESNTHVVVFPGDKNPPAPKGKLTNSPPTGSKAP